MSDHETADFVRRIAGATLDDLRLMHGRAADTERLLRALIRQKEAIERRDDVDMPLLDREAIDGLVPELSRAVQGDYPGFRFPVIHHRLRRLAQSDPREVRRRARVVKRVEPVIGSLHSFPAGQHSLAGDKLLGSFLSGEMLSEGEMFLHPGAEEDHGATLTDWRGESAMDPGFPVVGIDIEDVDLLGRVCRDVIAFADVEHSLAGF